MAGMIGITAAIVYVVIWVGYGRRLSIFLLDAWIRRCIAKRPTLYKGPDAAAEMAEEYRDGYVFAGFALAAFWPLVMPVRGLYRLIGARGGFTTPVELAYAERAELGRLREQAADLGLPMPEVASDDRG